MRKHGLGALRAGLFIVVTIFVATMGPFGSYEQGAFGARLAYWTVVNAVSLAIAVFWMAAAERFFGGVRIFYREVGLCLAQTTVFTPFLHFWTLYYFPAGAGTMPDFIRMALYVFAVCVCISLLRFGLPQLVMQKQIVEDAQPKTVTRAHPLPRLLERFEERSRSPVQRISVDGHKVQVVMRNGRKEIRMRFSDAVQEMEGVAGFSTHRSHWVAESAIAGVEIGAKGRPKIVLQNGDVIPVSRKYEPELAQRGFI